MKTSGELIMDATNELERLGKMGYSNGEIIMLMAAMENHIHLNNIDDWMLKYYLIQRTINKKVQP